MYSFLESIIRMYSSNNRVLYIWKKLYFLKIEDFYNSIRQSTQLKIRKNIFKQVLHKQIFKRSMSMWKFQISLVVLEMQNKITMINHYTPGKWLKLRGDNTKFWQGGRVIILLYLLIGLHNGSTTLKNNLKFKILVQNSVQSNKPGSKFFTKINENLCSCKELYVDIYCSIITVPKWKL